MKFGEEHSCSEMPNLIIRRVCLSRVCLHLAEAFVPIKQYDSSKGIDSAVTSTLIIISCPT